MAFVVVQSKGEGDVAFNLPLAPAAGNLVVLALRWEGATGANNASIVQGGGASFNMLARADNAGGDHHAQIGYLFNVTATNQFDVTIPASGVVEEVTGVEMSHSEAASLDTTHLTGQGASGTALVSGAITLDSAAAMFAVLGFGTSYSGTQTFSARTINSVAADGFVNGADQAGSPYSTLFWRLLTSPFTNGTAAVTASVDDDWHCHIVAFKAGTGGATALTVVLGEPIIGGSSF